jgi:hypothetical protein
MVMVRQHDPGMNIKWRPHLTDSIAQKIDIRRGSLATAIIKVDGKKLCIAGNAMTPKISHTSNSAVKTETEQ